jgi:hypothetical protein
MRQFLFCLVRGMETKIMSRSNDSSNLATLDDHRPLADSELDAVSGGAFPIVMAQMALLNQASGA